MKNPVAVLIDKALIYIQRKDPSWNDAQPLYFRAEAVEQLKQQIQSSMLMNSRVHWTLDIGDETFGCNAPLFCTLDWEYNPYITQLQTSVLLQ